MVDEHNIVDASFMQERKLVEGMRELCRGVFGGAFKPLDAFLWSLRHTQFAVEFGNTEPVQCAGMGRSARFAIKLDGLGGLPTATPAILAACPGAVGGVRVAVFSGEDEEREGAVKVLAVLVCPDAIRVAVGEEVLRRHVTTISITLEEGSGLLYEIFALFDRLFNIHDVGRGKLGNWEGLGGVDHEDGKLKLEVRILCLFCVCAVELESSFVGQEGGLLSRP